MSDVILITYSHLINKIKDLEDAWVAAVEQQWIVEVLRVELIPAEAQAASIQPLHRRNLR